MKVYIRIFFLLLLISVKSYAESEVFLDTITDNTKTKKGFSFGAVPALGYNSDIGFQYGLVTNLYHYGDGKQYPKYLHSLFLEWSRTTKGSGINRIKYDSEYLIPGMRLTCDLNYLTEKALDFYGFNGYEAAYNPDLENDNSAGYISRMYYRHERKMLRFIADLQGRCMSSNLRWIGGIGIFSVKINSVDIDMLNKGQKPENELPDTASLYDKYVEWGIIEEEEKNGGNTNTVKLGLVYDTRDNEPNPMQGIWTEAFFVAAPSFLGNHNYSYTKFVLTHRQYFTFVPEKLSFAYRISYNGTIQGRAPFYMQPWILSSFDTRDGLGGDRTLRGIMRNRVVGDGFLLGNVELRWKFVKTVLLNQNIYLAASPFADFGLIVQRHEFDQTNVPASDRIALQNDRLHTTVGIGIRMALNENFIVGIDYGKALDRQDGNKGLYIGIGFLY